MMISDFEYKAKKINGCLVIALNFFFAGRNQLQAVEETNKSSTG